MVQFSYSKPEHFTKAIFDFQNHLQNNLFSLTKEVFLTFKTDSIWVVYYITKRIWRIKTELKIIRRILPKKKKKNLFSKNTILMKYF